MKSSMTEILEIYTREIRLILRPLGLENCTNVFKEIFKQYLEEKNDSHSEEHFDGRQIDSQRLFERVMKKINEREEINEQESS